MQDQRGVCPIWRLVSSYRTSLLLPPRLIILFPVSPSQLTFAMASENREPPPTAISVGPHARASSPALPSPENPPPQPPRPMSPQQQAQATLHEAFPSIDPAVVRAVLVASSGQIEPAFTALLSGFSRGLSTVRLRTLAEDFVR